MFWACLGAPLKGCPMLAGKELRWCKVASNKITGLEELFGTPNVLPCLRVLNLERNFITSTKGLQASARQTL